jgi:hypothetical protein
MQLHIYANGCRGALSTEIEELEFGPLLVGQPTTQDLVLMNNGSCDLTYHLSLAIEEQGEWVPLDNANATKKKEYGKLINLSNANGFIASKGKAYSKISVKPLALASYRFKVLYNTTNRPVTRPITAWNNPDSRLAEQLVLTKPTPEALCLVKARGVYPLLQVADIRSENRSQRDLWERFSLSELNRCLQKHTNSEKLENDPSFGKLEFDFGGDSKG